MAKTKQVRKSAKRPVRKSAKRPVRKSPKKFIAITKPGLNLRNLIKLIGKK